MDKKDSVGIDGGVGLLVPFSLESFHHDSFSIRVYLM